MGSRSNFSSSLGISTPARPAMKSPAKRLSWDCIPKSPESRCNPLLLVPSGDSTKEKRQENPRRAGLKILRR
jgi:hypothetical protein